MAAKKSIKEMAFYLEEVQQQAYILEMALWGLMAMSEDCQVDTEHITPLVLLSQKLHQEIGQISEAPHGS